MVSEPRSSHAAVFSDPAPAPLVSVVIPAYRCAPYVAQALDSVFGQSFSDYEIIVVNDGSPDTALLEAALAPYREKILYFKQATRGPSGARNTGILQARGKYIAFLDGDDYWCSDHLEKQVAVLQQSPAFDLAYCDTFLLKEGKGFGRVFSMEPQSPEVTFESLLTEDCVVSTSSAVASRAALMRAGLFDESFRRCEDFDMWLRMAFTGARITFHTEAQVYHRISPDSLSADRWSMKRDRIRVYQKIGSTLPVSEEQSQIIARMVAHTEAQCDVEQLKDALEKGDYSRAVDAANRAGSRRSNWKLKASLFGLRVAPRLFRLLHLGRSLLLSRQGYSRRPRSV